MKGIYVSLAELLELGQPKMMRTGRTRVKNRFAAGQHHARAHGRGMEFDQVRRYEPGDDIRAMDWRVTARTNKPHTKLFHQEKEQPTYILVDQSSSLFFGSQTALKSVTAARAAAFFAWQSFHRGDRVGGIILGTQTTHSIKPRGGKSGLQHFLHGLVEYNQALYHDMQQATLPQDNLLEQGLSLLSHLIKHNTRVIIISDFYAFNEQCHNSITQLSRHNQLIGVHIYDLLEKELPKRGHYTLSNGMDRFSLDTAPAQLRNQFREQFIARQEKAQADFQQCGAQWLSLGTHEVLPIGEFL